MTNATIQKMCYLTLNSTSGAHRPTSEGAQGPPPIGALLFMASATHELFKGVNLIDHVSLEDRLRIQQYGWVWLGWEYGVCTEGDSL
jgi:hypothetical protein